MAFELNSITQGKRIRAPRIVLLGVEKIGKSTFAACSDCPLFIPIVGEEGVDDLGIPQFPTVQKYQDVIDCLGVLYREDHEYKTVVIDSASTLESIIWERTCRRNPSKNGSIPESIEKVGGGYAKGYTEALIEWNTILEGLDALRTQKNMASIIIGHVRVKRFDDPAGLSYDQYQFDLHDKAASKLYRWADAILFCNTKVTVKQEDAGFNRTVGKALDITGGQRFLYTQKRPAHPGGGRGVFGRLPYELPLSWAAYQQAIVEQIQKEGTK